MKHTNILPVAASVVAAAAVITVGAFLFSGFRNAEDSIEAGSTAYSGTVTEAPHTTETEAAVNTVIGTETPTTAAQTLPETTEEETTAPAPIHVSVEGITLTVYELYLEAGQSQMPIVTMYPENATDKSEIWVSSDDTVAAVDMYGNITGIGAGSCVVTVTSADNGAVSASVSVSVSVPPETEPPTPVIPPQESELTYINGILVVNKTYSLPENYNPGADPTAYAALTEMFSAAASEGLSLWVKSGFRSYNDQKWQYNYYAERDGQALADTYSARPGHSEHQSGLAFDLNSLYKSFADTAEGKWLAANCHKYGFIIRYPAGKEHITGYMYEPWHVRYLGIDTATAVYESGLCLEEYLGITSEYTY